MSETGSALQAGHFAEPLIATAPSNPAEDRALTQALAAYARRSQPDDVSDLIDYLTDHPHSVWASALQTNLGLHYLHDDYFSRAIEAWQKAWDEGKDATEPHARAMVDRAIGERARL